MVPGLAVEGVGAFIEDTPPLETVYQLNVAPSEPVAFN